MLLRFCASINWRCDHHRPRELEPSRRRNLIGMSLVRFAEAQTFAGVPLPLPQIRASTLKITFLLVLRLVLVLGPFAFLLVALKLK